ncbi:MAG: sterol desaturase family protein [bacterium]|nr:sterol desaturase family protein [bacterium]
MNLFEILNGALDAGLYFVLLGVGLAPLERAFAARKQPLLRPEFATDLLFYFGQSLLFTKLTLWILWLAHDAVQSLTITVSIFAEWRAIFGDLPLWLQLPAVVLCSDLCIYWAHRWSHTNPWLWRFHRVHHTATRLDWAAAFREHPIDNIYTRLVVNLPAIALGFSFEAIAAFVVFRGFWGNVIHSNTSFGLGPLKYVLGSPRLHHWHHEPRAGMHSNFANLNPLMDVLFGTFYDPGVMPERYGIAGSDGDGDATSGRGYFAQLLGPFRPAKSRATAGEILFANSEPPGVVAPESIKRI